jgi:hypothetical protein
VYLQYAHARICSIIRKSNKDVEELKMVNLVFYASLVIGVVKVLVSFLLVISHGLKFSLNCFSRVGQFLSTIQMSVSWGFILSDSRRYLSFF